LIGQAPAFGSQYPLAEATVDFNGDGIPDLAVLWTASQYGGAPVNLTVYLGKGDGTFTAGPTTQAFASAPTGPVMIAGDFNGDGKADLAILTEDFGYSTNYVTCLLGKGDGSFASPITSKGNTIQNQGGDVVRGALVAVTSTRRQDGLGLGGRQCCRRLDGDAGRWQRQLLPCRPGTPCPARPSAPSPRATSTATEFPTS